MPRSILVADRWLWFTLRAGVAVLLALAALLAPRVGGHFLAATAGVLAIAAGGLALTLASPGRTAEPRWIPFAVEGVLGVAGGVAIFTLGTRGPAWLAAALGVWAATTGAAQTGAGLRLRRQTGEWLLAATGGVSLAAGITLVIRSPDGAFGLAPLLAGYALALGAGFLAVGLRLRAWSRHRERALPWIGSPARA